ncbi:hypothetical protein ABPG72_015781 [Tetrahymena utriculariae]
MKDSKLCLVCSQNKYKYKCPKCSVQYCGLGCFKTHKCEDYKKQNEQIQTINQETETIHKSNYVEDEELRVPKTKLEQLSKILIQLTNFLAILSLESSIKIKKILQSSKLRETLLKIDNARSRLWELNNEMKTNQHFMEFTQLLLGEMDMLNKSNEFI